MPVRPRRQRYARLVWTPELALALTIGPGGPGRDFDEATLAEAWGEYGPLLLAQSAPRTRPWAYWRFDAAVPQPLRAQRLELYPPEDTGRLRQAEQELDERRAAWLAEHDHAARCGETTT